jgi:hypothetical protein
MSPQAELRSAVSAFQKLDKATGQLISNTTLNKAGARTHHQAHRPQGLTGAVGGAPGLLPGPTPLSRLWRFLVRGPVRRCGASVGLRP